MYERSSLPSVVELGTYAPGTYILNLRAPDGRSSSQTIQVTRNPSYHQALTATL